MVSARRCLFVADPLSGLRVQSDSSLAILREGQKRGWQTYWATPDGLSFRNGDVYARARLVAVARADALPSTAGEQTLAVASFQRVFVRKDPPFDTHYLRMCWWLGLEESRTHFVNTPSSLLRFHEKLLPWEAVARGYLRPEQLVPTYTADVDGVHALLEAHPKRDYVIKPFFGFAGSAVERWNGGTLDAREAQLAQPFQEAIHRRGDRRVLYAAGQRIGDFVRRPPDGGFVSNLAAGGSAERLPMTEAETLVADGLGRFLAAVGITFAGADLIGDKLSEVNITSPTGLLALEKLEQIDGAARLWEAIDRAT